MKRSTIAILSTTLCATLVVRTVHAQWVVYDPTNYAEAVAANDSSCSTPIPPGAGASLADRHGVSLSGVID